MAQQMSAMRPPADIDRHRSSTRRVAGRRSSPRTIEETGLAVDHIEQLIVKTLYRAAKPRGHDVAERMRLPYSIARAAHRAAARRAARSKCAARPDRAPRRYRYALTDLGRDRARQYLDINQYVGSGAGAAGGLRRATCSALREARGYIDRERLRSGFSASRSSATTSSSSSARR